MHVFSTRATLLAALLSASRLALGQAPPPLAPYPTAARSDAWMDSVRQLPLPWQVAAIRARVLADTVLRHPPQYVCLMGVSAASREAYSRAQQPLVQAEQARPAGAALLYVVVSATPQASLTGSLATNRGSEATAFVQQLDKQVIQRVEFLKSGAPAAAIYGTRAANGAVMLTARQPARRP